MFKAMQSKQTEKHKIYDVIYVVKEVVGHAFIAKARRLAKIIVYDAIDNYRLVPMVDAVFVNTQSQKEYFQRYVGKTVKIFLLPHHVSNFKRVRHTLKPIVRELLVVGVLPPEHVMHALYSWGLENNISISLSAGQVKKAPPFVLGDRWSNFLAAYDVLVEWGYAASASFCFKSAARFTLALDVGVPTVAQCTEGFMEAVGGNLVYPLFANNGVELLKVLDEVVRNQTLRASAVAIGHSIAARFSLEHVSKALHTILQSLVDDTGYMAVFTYNNTIMNPKCSMTELRTKKVKLKWK